MIHSDFGINEKWKLKSFGAGNGDLQELYAKYTLYLFTVENRKGKREICKNTKNQPKWVICHC